MNKFYKTIPQKNLDWRLVPIYFVEFFDKNFSFMILHKLDKFYRQIGFAS